MINMDIDEIFKILKDNNLNPKYVEFNETNFSRKIEFSTKYAKCWINWHCNISELIIGVNYSNLIPFNSIEISTIHCSSRKTLAFYLKNVEFAVCQLSLQKLDWQEEI